LSSRSVGIKRKLKKTSYDEFDNFIKEKRGKSLVVKQDNAATTLKMIGNGETASSNAGNSLNNLQLSATQQQQPSSSSASSFSSALTATNRVNMKVPVPKWHPNWELSAVLSGHLGWVRCIAFDPSNEWFATGSADRTIKVSVFYAWFPLFFSG
jgi:pleiotropic regulator 1